MLAFANKARSTPSKSAGHAATSVSRTSQVRAILGAQRDSAGHSRVINTDIVAEYGASVGIPISQPLRIQPKLTVGAASGALEHEADRIADQVMRMAKPLSRSSITRPQAGIAGEAVVAPAVRQILSTTGQPLDAAARTYMEPRFGHDFEDVRIHTGSYADAAASSIGARAFTSGRDIVFSTGEYAPYSRDGRQLLAHELCHVIQQTGVTHHTLVQKQDKAKAVSQQKGGGIPSPPFDQTGFQRMIQEWSAMDKIKAPVAKQIATAYFNRPGKPLNLPDIVIHNAMTQEDRRYPGHIEPSYDAIYWAVYKALDLKKSGKGDKISDWQLVDYPVPQKTGAEDGKEIAKFGISNAAELIDDNRKYLKGVAKVAGAIVEPTDALRDKLVESGVKYGARWLTERSMVGLASLLTGAGELYVVAMIVWSAYELVQSLTAPKELSPDEQAQANIAIRVKEWLLEKKEASKWQKRLSEPYLQPKILFQKDNTTVVKYVVKY